MTPVWKSLTVCRMVATSTPLQVGNKYWSCNCHIGQLGCKAVSQCLGCEALGFTAKEVTVTCCKSLNVMKNAVGLICCRCDLKGKMGLSLLNGKTCGIAMPLPSLLSTTALTVSMISKTNSQSRTAVGKKHTEDSSLMSWTANTGVTAHLCSETA